MTAASGEAPGALQPPPALLDGASARFSANLRGPMAEWLRRGLQILARRFDSGSGLHNAAKLVWRTAFAVSAHVLFQSAPLLASAAPTAVAAAETLEGAWSNAGQYAAAPHFMKRPPAAGFPYPWLDRQYATFRIINAPQLTGAEGRAVYLEWRKDGPDGPISRQRLWIFTPGADSAKMDFFAFREPAGYAGASGTTERFAALGPADLIGYGAACSLALAPGPGGWSAAIDERCRITAQSGRTMRLGARITINADMLFYEEEGVLPDGSYAFRVPGGIAYEFKRLTR